MSSEPVYRRVGRGGAGNWYSKKDVEEAEKAQAADLEAQKGAAAGSGAPIERSITSATTATLSSSGLYARSGRGGAGNFSDQTSAVGTQQETEQDAEKIKAAVTASLSKPRIGGRGGAGNWAGAATPDNNNNNSAPQKQEEEQKKVEEIELKVREDVAGLAMPRPAYHQPTRDD